MDMLLREACREVRRWGRQLESDSHLMKSGMNYAKTNDPFKVPKNITVFCDQFLMDTEFDDVN